MIGEMFLTTRYLFGDDRVIIGEKDMMWVRCSKCGIDIERTKRLANTKFCCHDCRRMAQKVYDLAKKAKKHVV